MGRPFYNTILSVFKVIKIDLTRSKILNKLRLLPEIFEYENLTNISVSYNKLS